MIKRFPSVISVSNSMLIRLPRFCLVTLGTLHYNHTSIMEFALQLFLQTVSSAAVNQSQEFNSYYSDTSPEF